MSDLQKTIARTFLEMAEGLESGSYGPRPKIALTGMGSEHGEENAMQAAIMASKRGVDVYYIGSLEAEGITTIHVADDEEGHKKMEQMVENGEVDGAVTMHFPFPIGVSTVGRVVTPAKGKEMFVANTTGTSSGDRIEGIVTDGDVRRAMERLRGEFFNIKAADIATRNPKTIAPDEKLIEAEKMMTRNKVTSLLVTDDAGKLSGVIQIYDIKL